MKIVNYIHPLINVAEYGNRQYVDVNNYERKEEEVDISSIQDIDNDGTISFELANGNWLTIEASEWVIINIKEEPARPYGVEV